ncbi:MAG: hypothetical protein ABW252_05635 [Polyangiales bacterium]
MWRRACVGGVPAMLVLVSCLYDPDDRCGDDMRHLEGRVCVCDPGTVEVSGRCAPTPPPTGGLGVACADDAACGDPAYPHCHRAEPGGYCTMMGCTTTADCPQTYFCVRDGLPAYCARFPTGQGKTCRSSDDCKGLDASFCGVGDPRGATCWVPHCTDLSCAPGFMCFDVSAYLPGAPKVCVQ